MNDEIIIINGRESDITPLFCPVCRFVMNNSDDDVYYTRYKCCSDCAIKWAEPNRDRWIAGWRPLERDLDVEIKKRKLIPPSFQI